MTQKTLPSPIDWPPRADRKSISRIVALSPITNRRMGRMLTSLSIRREAEIQRMEMERLQAFAQAMANRD